MPCNLFQKLNSMPKIFLRNDIFHSNLIDKNFNVHVLYQNEYVKSAVQVQFPEEMYAISLGQQIHSRKKNEYYSHFFHNEMIFEYHDCKWNIQVALFLVFNVHL